MGKPDLVALIDCLRDYEECYLSKGSARLQYSEPFDLEEGFRRNSYYPYASDKKVYAILDSEGVVLYVGKASHGGTLGARFASYFSYNKDSASGAAFQPRSINWTRPPCSIVAVKVVNAWEASSLEEYLIAKLAPEDNTVGKQPAPADPGT